MNSPARNSFTDEVLSCAQDDAHRRALAAILRKWAGQQVYVKNPDPGRPAGLARQLVRAGVGRAEGARILSERTGLGSRQCRRLMRDAGGHSS